MNPKPKLLTFASFNPDIIITYIIKICKHVRSVELLLSVKVPHTDEGTCQGEEEEEDLLSLVSCEKMRLEKRSSAEALL